MPNLLVLSLLVALSSAADEGCSHMAEVLCSRDKVKNTRICKKTVEECDAFAGCNDPSSPFLCPNGDCAMDFFTCKDKYFVCKEPE